jgi:hypothetical protein
VRGCSAVFDRPRLRTLTAWVKTQGQGPSTSSARASSCGGISSPNTLAVLRLRTSSNLVDCTTGRSAGPLSLKCASDIVAGLPIGVRKIGAVTPQTTRSAKVTEFEIDHCGHRLDRNPAAQQSPAVPRCAIVWGGSTRGGWQRPTSIQNDSDLPQGLAGLSAAG